MHARVTTRYNDPAGICVNDGMFNYVLTASYLPPALAPSATGKKAAGIVLRKDSSRHCKGEKAAATDPTGKTAAATV